MAEIIDLDFYRRFGIALPLRREVLQMGEPFQSAHPQSKRFKKRDFVVRRAQRTHHHSATSTQEKE